MEAHYPKVKKAGLRLTTFRPRSRIHESFAECHFNLVYTKLRFSEMKVMTTDRPAGHLATEPTSHADPGISAIRL